MNISGHHRVVSFIEFFSELFFKVMILLRAQLSDDTVLIVYVFKILFDLKIWLFIFLFLRPSGLHYIMQLDMVMIKHVVFSLREGQTYMPRIM